jgi:hypothetical protein
MEGLQVRHKKLCVLLPFRLWQNTRQRRISAAAVLKRGQFNRKRNYEEHKRIGIGYKVEGAGGTPQIF